MLVALKGVLNEGGCIRRSATLRTYAGDTSLPGGKAEEGDRSVEDTAVRFAAVFFLFFFLYYLSNFRLLLYRDERHLKRYVDGST